jgi:hypothetical protein
VRGETHIAASDRKALEAVARYMFGAYSDAARGKRRKAAARLQPAAAVEARAELSPEQAARRRSWAELLRRVYEVDPLICPKCAGKMRVVAVILDPPVVKRILDHRAKRRRAVRAPPHSPSAVVA